MDVRSVLDARREAPRSTENKAIVFWDGRTGPSPLTGDHWQARLTEQVADRAVAQEGGTRSDRQRCSHQHPSGGWITVGQVLDHLKRRHRVELCTAGHRLGHPHAEESFAVKRIHDRLGQLSFPVTELSMLVSDERHSFCCLLYTSDA